MVHPNRPQPFGSYTPMAAFAAQRMRAASRLSQLYTDTKQTSQTAAPPTEGDDSPQILSLNQKYNIQKDRLIAWGLEWTDDPNNGQADIEKALEKEGLAELAMTIMENIKSILDQVEQIRSPPQSGPTNFATKDPASHPQLRRWTTSDISHYHDLVENLTSAIDVLCDLSKSRRNTTSGEKSNDHFGEKNPGNFFADSSHEASKTHSDHHDPHFADYVATGDYEIPPELPPRHSEVSRIPRINQSALILPEEGPPPYHDPGVLPWGASTSSRTPRVFANLRHTAVPFGLHKANTHSDLTPVMVEYASFDNIYKTSDIPLPLNRLEQLYTFLDAERSADCKTFTKLIAYFEDPKQPRYGLVFALPQKYQDLYYSNPSSILTTEPVNLSVLLHSASRTSTSSISSVSSNAYVPPLEDRFRLAMEIVRGFSHLQQQLFLHRNISSTSIALLPRSNYSESNESRYDLRQPQICSIDLFHEYDVNESPEYLLQNIYRHPDDPRVKGPTAAETHELRFDIYSLGLLLLEIGMWHPLADMYKEKYSLRDFRIRVERLWIKKLAGRCGTSFMRCVQDCITAGNVASDDQPTVERVYARVLTRLERCCWIDEEEDDQDVIRASEKPKSTSTPQQSHQTNEYTEEPVMAEPEAMTPQESFEKPLKPKIHRPRYQFPNLELPTEVLWQYNNAIEARLAKIMQKALGQSRESCSIHLCYTGENEQLAKPTICVSCSSTKKVRAAIKRHLKYPVEVFDLAIINGGITRSKTRARRSQGTPQEQEVLNPHHHQRPLCGASIGAWKDNEHSPAVSFGGVVILDGQAYGMSVHHLLERPDEEDDEVSGQLPPTRSMDHSQPQFSTKPSLYGQAIELIEDEDEDDEDEEDDEDFDFDDGFSDIDSSYDPDDDTLDFADMQEGDTIGVTGDDGHEIIITQPALNDVKDDFFPCEEDKDEDHIDSHSLGRVHASSGLRRYVRNGVEHEVDWLLMKLEEERFQPYNMIAGGRRYCHEDSLFSFRPSLKEPVCRQHYTPAEDLYPRQIAPSDQLSGMHVHCFGRTSGLGHGRISQTMHLVRFAGRRTFSRTWAVSGTFGVGGDSGAWVVDNDQGRICGHVLAWSNTLGMAYISPMDVMFEDIQHELGTTEIALPGAEDPLKPNLAALPDIAEMSLDDIRGRKGLMAKHMLQSGNPGHLEREWASRRTGLGQLASG